MSRSVQPCSLGRCCRKRKSPAGVRRVAYVITPGSTSLLDIGSRLSCLCSWQTGIPSNRCMSAEVEKEEKPVEKKEPPKPKPKPKEEKLDAEHRSHHSLLKLPLWDEWQTPVLRGFVPCHACSMLFGRVGGTRTQASAGTDGDTYQADGGAASPFSRLSLASVVAAAFAVIFTLLLACASGKARFSTWEDPTPQRQLSWRLLGLVLACSPQVPGGAYVQHQSFGAASENRRGKASFWQQHSLGPLTTCSTVPHVTM